MKTTLTTLALSLALLTGCASTPYSAPQVAVPQSWQGDAQAIASAKLDGWWRAFGNTQLNALVDQVLTSNNDLALATLKVRTAQLQAGITADEQWPSFSAGADLARSKNLKNGDNSKSNSVSASVSYEIDLWGKLSSQTAMARWEFEATLQDREATLQSLIGTTVTLYWKAAYLNERVAQSAASIEYAKKTLALVEAQYKAGASSQLEKLEAEQSVATQEASHASLVQQQTENRNALTLLLNAAPGQKTLTIAEKVAQGQLPEVAAGLPADLLARRPDLKASELRLKKSFTHIDATRASYYPSFSLTGSLGSSSSDLAKALQNPVASLGAGLTLPFLQWTQMKLNIQVSETEYEQAVVSFRQTLYSALADVENALSARKQYRIQQVQLEKSLAAASAAEKLCETKYRLGAVTMQSWLDAQEKRRSAENSLAENRYNQLANHATLCQALGGGFSSSENKPANAG